MMERFVTDECVHARIPVCLRETGRHVIDIRVAHPGVDDRTVLDLSVRHRAVLVTADYDFANLVFVETLPAYAVTVLAPGSFDPKDATSVEHVAWRIIQLEPDLKGHLTVLSRNGTRQIKLSSTVD